MNIAVTGNVGSGKSAVSAMLAGLLQGDLVDADILCRDLLMTGRQGWVELRERWADEYFEADGELDRKKLRDAVFQSNEVRRELEQILHPLVETRLEQLLILQKECGTHLVAEIPLLYEVGWAHRFDCVVAVYAPSSLCIERTAQRDSVAGSQVQSILDLQLPPEEKAERADFFIDNSESWSQTAVQSFVVSREIQRLQRVEKRAGLPA